MTSNFPSVVRNKQSWNRENNMMSYSTCQLMEFTVQKVMQEERANSQGRQLDVCGLGQKEAGAIPAVCLTRIRNHENKQIFLSQVSFFSQGNKQTSCKGH